MAAETLLSSLLCLLFLGFLLPARLAGGVGSLNLEELSEMRYGIEILPLPVIGGQTKDWWTYQFCYGRHIQQYHMEDSEIKGDILYLGYYQSAFDWDDETAKASKQHRLKRYHSQTYGNGSKCDLNGRPREAEVRFLCDEGAGISGDYIDRVDEPLSCSYVLTVRTPRLCAHPLLRPSPSAAPQAILCHPSLQPEEYKAYLRQQEREDSKQQEEKITEQLQDLDSPVRSETKSGAPPPKREGVSPAKDDSQESDFWQMLREPEDQAPGGEEAQAEEQYLNLQAAADPAPGPPDDFQNNVQVKVIRSPSDLIRLIEELKGGTKKGKPSAGAEQPGDVAAEEGPAREPEGKAKGDPERPSAGDEAEREEDEEEEADEQQLLGEFEKELEGILLPSDRERLQRLRSQLKAGAERERELESATQENPDSTPTGAFQTEKELNTDMLKKESERERAILALTSTVNKLIKRLEENQSRELAKKYRKRKAVPRKPLPAPHSAGKIEIKIVRPGAEGPEEDGRWLTDEDTKSLKEIFFNILVQGAEEAHKERQRQKDLESNYRRVWGSRDGEGLGDLDEFDF
ncbi:PREDICTED: protein OS-9 [Chinchilla lanigera]|uniref:protein OS-9 n=1 Tax=Chinchilla lanigera TaxID=34839 RepID=UPI0006969BAC|nr:PREDICTED: protein OS-9 [Chinchilla lanigera]